MRAILGIVKNIRSQLRGYKRRSNSFIVLLFILVISFQNCSPGKFELPSGENSSTDSLGSIGTGLTPGSGANPTPTPDTTNLTPEQIAALAAAAAIKAKEDARQLRCKEGLQKPIIANAAEINNMVYDFKVGLDTGSGDTSSVNQPVYVDASKGVKSSVAASDNCTYSTTLRLTAVDPARDATHPATFIEGVTATGDPIVLSATATAFASATKAIRTNPGNNNNAFSSSTSPVNFSFMNVTQNRSVRCATGSVYYAVAIRVSTTNLNNNTNLESDPVYVKANFANSCWTQAKLIGSTDYQLNANAGSKVALSGSWAAVLAPKDENRGAVYLFNNSGSGWVFSQKLTMPDAVNGHVLSNLDLKGGILAVSNSSIGDIGKVYIYKLSGSVWTYSQSIASPEPSVSSQKFGLGLALGSNVLVVGSPDHPKSGFDSGKAYIFNYDGSSFAYRQTLEGSGNTNYGFGKTIVISGSKMAIGAPGLIGDNNPGIAFIFNNSSSWTQEMAILPPSGISNAAGFGSAIAFNGSALAVGAPLHDEGTTADNGKVYFYANYTVALTHSLAGGGAGVKLGSSLGFSSDSLFVGAIGGGTNASGIVSRYLFSNLNSSVTATKNIKTYTQFSQDITANEYFGQSLAVEGNSIIIGAPAKSVPFDKGGAAYVYVIR